MNKFYNQPLILLWIEAVILTIVGFVPAIFIIEMGYERPIFYLLFFIYLPLGQFSLTPLLRLTGVYKYYSPMLLGYNANNITIDLHSGGSFDYLFAMRGVKSGTATRNLLLCYYLEGLLNIIQQIENKQIEETVQIEGTSYFFNEKTASKFGFIMSTPSLFYKINLLVNFVDLCWMYSFSEGKLSIPKVWKVKKVTISGKELVANKTSISALHKALQKKLKLVA